MTISLNSIPWYTRYSYTKGIKSILTGNIPRVNMDMICIPPSEIFRIEKKLITFQVEK